MLFCPDEGGYRELAAAAEQDPGGDCAQGSRHAPHRPGQGGVQRLVCAVLGAGEAGQDSLLSPVRPHAGGLVRDTHR